MELLSTVKKEDLPEEPTNQNRFLKRRCSPDPKSTERSSTRRSGHRVRERSRDRKDRKSSTTRVTRSGIRVKGRGAIRFHADNLERDRSRSITPPHWRREEVYFLIHVIEIYVF